MSEDKPMQEAQSQRKRHCTFRVLTYDTWTFGFNLIFDRYYGFLSLCFGKRCLSWEYIK